MEIVKTPKKRGRKPKATTEEIVEALKKTAGGVYLAAKALGVTPEALYQRRDKEPEIRAAMERPRKELVDIAEASIMRAVANGEAWAICFTLKCHGRDRGWIEKQDIRHEVVDVRNLTDEELERIAYGR